MELPAGSRFSWPFYTYSPYGSVRVPENLEAALGVVSTPLNGDSDWVRVRFSVETRK
jgi:hypothetical protein